MTAGTFAVSPGDGSTIAAGDALVVTVSGNSGLFSFSLPVEVSFDGGATYVDAYGAGYTVVIDPPFSFNFILTLTADAGWSSGPMLLRVTMHASGTTVGPTVFAYTVATAAPTPVGAADNLDWPALLTRTRYAGMGVNTIAWGGGQPLPPVVIPQDAGTMATRRLLAQYADKPGIVGLVRAAVSQLGALEAAVQTMIQRGDLDAGVGPALDHTGEVVGLDRGGRADNDYRVALAAMVKTINASGATSEECRNIVDWCYQGLAAARLIPQPPGCAILRAFEVPQAAGMLAGLCMDRASAAGKRVIVQWERPSYEGTTFGFSDDLASGTWADWGADPSNAGLWAEGWDGVQQ